MLECRYIGLVRILLGRLLIPGRLSLRFRHRYVVFGRFSTNRASVCDCVGFSWSVSCGALRPLTIYMGLALVSILRTVV